MRLVPLSLFLMMLPLTPGCDIANTDSELDPVPDRAPADQRGTVEGQSSGSGSGGGEETKLSYICDDKDGLFGVLLDAVFTCFPEFDVLFGTLDDPQERRDLCRESFQPLLDDGSMVLGGPEALSACSDFLANAHCENFTVGGPNFCDSLYVGQLPVGSACDMHEQCAGDVYCAGGSPCGTCVERSPNGTACLENDSCSSGNCSQGFCRPLSDLGEECNVNSDCLGRQVCDRGQSPSVCISEPDWQVGTPCSEFPSGCNAVTSDLYCNPEIGQCEAYSQVGEVCGPTRLCRLYKYESCQPNASGEFRCVAPTITNNIGDACGFFLGVQCGEGLTCHEDVCKTLLERGDDCTEPQSVCGPFLNCIDQKCRYRKHTGMCPPL